MSINPVTSDTSSIRQRFAGDLHRPRYHFLPPSNWMNDPNGVIQWQGNYHLFYQHNPYGATWGNMHWGHAISKDLIHWADLPIAIAPTPGSYDEAGIFSGCAVNNNGVPTIFYTSTRGERNEIQTQSLATSDDLLTWEKHPGNPVIRDVPAESGQQRDFRDPFVWREDDAWYMVLGSRIQDVGGAVFLYRSHNLTDWEYLNPLLVGDIKHNGVIWECPNFFKLGDQWVLIVSTHVGTATDTVLYFVGSYENYKFTPQYEGVLDYAHLYAPLSMLDDQNRRILFGWIREKRTDREMNHAGWSGVQSIPRVLTLDGHTLNMTPVPELAAIRGREHRYEAMELNGTVDLDVRGLNLDIEAEFAAQPDGTCGLGVVFSADGRERLEIGWDAAKNTLFWRAITPHALDSSMTQQQEVPHQLRDGEALRLRILMDGSVVEIIANDRTSLTGRIYPTHMERNQVQLIGKNARLQSLKLWEMPSIWQ